jgi:mono/diheme cytochrome c family protein
VALSFLGLAFLRHHSPGGAAPDADPLERGRQLFASHCAPCHGERGDGNGPSAHHLVVRPRDFAEAKFRLVTTANRMPSDDDLLRVITRGMPGSPMFPSAQLSEADRRLLVAYTRHLTLTGRVEQERARLGPGEDVAELTREVAEQFRPGEPVAVPDDLPAATLESVARGAALYRRLGCVACHGETGGGDGAQEQRDDRGLPVRPADFRGGFFKSGRDPKQLYCRIVLGMPGTPMPGVSGLAPQQVGDLVNFVLSLSESPSG